MIATYFRKAYFVSMVAARLMLFFAMLAMLVAPIGMLNGSAMATDSLPVSASSQKQSIDHTSHCAEMSSENEGQTGGGTSQGDCVSDCAMACSAVAAPGSRTAERDVSAAVMEAGLPVDTLHGLNPEASDPPPRTA